MWIVLRFWKVWTIEIFAAVTHTQKKNCTVCLPEHIYLQNES